MKAQTYTLTVKQNGIMIKRIQSENRKDLVLRTHKIVWDSQMFRTAIKPTFNIV